MCLLYSTLLSVQSLSRVWLFATPWTAADQASLSIINSRSLLKLMSIESVMPSNHRILCLERVACVCMCMWGMWMHVYVHACFILTWCSTGRPGLVCNFSHWDWGSFNLVFTFFSIGSFHVMVQEECRPHMYTWGDQNREGQLSVYPFLLRQ